jgi:hypothetical protein
MGISAVNGSTMYIEYDRGNRSQEDFNKRCSLMRGTTNHLYIVAQNKNILIKSLRQQVRDWIKTCDPQKLKNTRISLSTILNLANTYPDDPWLVEYDLDKSFKPIRDFDGT